MTITLANRSNASYEVKGRKLRIENRNFNAFADVFVRRRRAYARRCRSNVDTVIDRFDRLCLCVALCEGTSAPTPPHPEF